MNLQVRPLSSAGFVFALFCFLLPWVSVSCPGNTAAMLRLTGTQLAMGTTVREPSLLNAGTERRVPGEPLALAVVASCILGLVGAIVSGRSAKFIAVAGGAVGVVLLLLLKTKVESDVAQEAPNVLEVHWEIGYWGTFFALLASFFINLLILRALAARSNSV